MRWIPEGADALLQLRCIELNGDWDHFFDWSYNRWIEQLQQQKNILIGTNEPIDLSAYKEAVELNSTQNCKMTSIAA